MVIVPECRSAACTPSVFTEERDVERHLVIRSVHTSGANNTRLLYLLKPAFGIDECQDSYRCVLGQRYKKKLSTGGWSTTLLK